MISLAMPTYNGGKYLRSQLDSIYAQTMVPDEVIVVDDASTDDTVSILQEYKEKYGLIYFVNDSNLGYNKNFEKAISLCSGDYIVLCDQDDVWLPEKIEKCYNLLSTFASEEPSLVSCFSSTNPEILESGAEKCEGGDWKSNFVRYTSQGCTLMFNRKLRDLLLPFPEEIIYDAYIGFSASLLGNRAYLGEKLMYYRIHGTNSFQKNTKKGKLSVLKDQLKKPVPFFFGIQRFKTLRYVRDRFGDKALPERLAYLDEVISLYEVNNFKKIAKLLRLNEMPRSMRMKAVVLLIAQTILGVKNPISQTAV